MDRESFQDAEIAQLLNTAFISIDVDREKRPDVDAVYMAACHAMTGQGGWPLTCILTPSQKPFYIATYLPKQELYAVLLEAKKQYAKHRERVVKLGKELQAAVNEQFRHEGGPVALERVLLTNAVKAYAAAYDADWAGLGYAPKFPMPHTLSFLLRHGALSGEERALQMAEDTLTRMCEGGIFDHVGGGFMRYATDRRWQNPHFEKMLSDNALLADAYMEAWQITDRPLYRSVAERTLSYVLREMRSPEGAFFTAQDADAEGHEGAFYTFTRRELLSLLGKEDGPAYMRYYNIMEQGHPHRVGHSGGIETQRMAALNETVRAYRAERMPLFRDEKILAGWNGQMIRTLARAYQATGHGTYREAAVRAAEFIRERMTRPDGSLYAYFQKGEAAGKGLLDDYAWLADAALSLYQVTLEGRWLTWAVTLGRIMLDRFEDLESGGFFLTPHDGEALIARPKETYDGAQPSGNAVALSVLMTLSLLDVGEGWIEAAERQLSFLTGLFADSPLQHMAGLTAGLPLLYTAELLDAHAGEPENERLLASLRGKYLPLLFLKASQPDPGGSRWRLCKGKTCLSPFSALEEVLASL